ncbi:MAG TPA: hypothetical protein VK465_06995 [Fibrobacteria bacterium]|nr:hypothetical protein [Geothrix sp.]HLP41237.1 hypothetical protein [Fibrobacteria bacterium]
MSSTFCPVSASIDRYLRDIDQEQAEQEMEWDPELESLEATPEGREWMPDGRDATKAPPAYLNPRWILRMRRRLDHFRNTGRVDWMTHQGKVAK